MKTNFRIVPKTPHSNEFKIQIFAKAFLNIMPAKWRDICIRLHDEKTFSLSHEWYYAGFDILQEAEEALHRIQVKKLAWKLW